MSNVVSGRQFRTARIFARLSQAEFAKAVGIDERSLRYLELKDDGFAGVDIRREENDRGRAAAKWRCPNLISDDGRSTPDAILIPSMSDEITMSERWLVDLTEDAGGYLPGVGCETRDR